MIMRRIYLALFFLLLSTGALHSQETISVDAVSAMQVCSEKNSASAGPCATTPRAMRKVNPSYPEKARRSRKEGTVTLGLMVNKDGSVSGVHVVNGVDKEIDQAAVDAVSQWRFDPGTYQGNAVDVDLTVTVNFRLNTSAQQSSPDEHLQEKRDAADDFRNTFSAASEAYNRADYATTVNLMRKLTSSNPENANAWNELGRALLEMNQLDAASEALQRAIQKDPGSRNAYNNLGRVYWRQQMYGEAAAQFRKQILVNPDDHYAHRNLGMMLRDEHQCGEAMPELQKALALTPNHAETLLAEGECDLDLGNQAKGMSELEQATSVSSAPNIFNSAAYALAKRNVEIEIAEKWSEKCLSIENTRLQDISLDHLTADQLNYVFWMSNYWDTRGWIYFLRGDNTKARSYLEASWSLLPNPSVGGHLGQIYEKSGRLEEAVKVYAMAIAAAELPTRERIDLDDLADVKKRLTKLAPETTNTKIVQGRGDLSARNVVTIANEGALNASGDFAVRLSADGKPAEFRQLNGDNALAKFSDSLRAAKLPISLPETPGVEVPLRGTLTCHSEETRCRFGLLSPEDAVNVTRNEMAMATATPTTSVTRDPHVYDDPAMGMRISLPDDWKLVKVDPGSFSHPRNAMFGKSGSTAMFMLTREHFEGSIELYLKMLDNFFSKRTEFERTRDEKVTRDGLAGTRWNVSWKENGIVYASAMEIFGEGDDYYRVTAFAPKEVYGRYTEAFENMLHSVQFPMLRVNPQVAGPLN